MRQESIENEQNRQLPIGRQITYLLGCCSLSAPNGGPGANRWEGRVSAFIGRAAGNLTLAHGFMTHLSFADLRKILVDFIHSYSRFEGQKSAPCRVSDAPRRVNPISLNQFLKPLLSAAFVLCSTPRIRPPACHQRPPPGCIVARAAPDSDPPAFRTCVGAPTENSPLPAMRVHLSGGRPSHPIC